MRLSQIISFIFHPLLLTTYMVGALGYWSPELLLIRKEFILPFAAFIFGITFATPVLNIYFFRQFNLISSFNMESRKERLLPFVFNSVIYVLIAGIFVYKIQLSSNFTKLMMIVATLAVAASVCTFFFKISVHSLSWGGLLGIFVRLNQALGGELLIPLLLILIISGFVMSARLRLGAHTPVEVWTGMLAGLAIGFAGMSILFG